MRKLLKRPDLGIIIGCLFIFALFTLYDPAQWFNWGTVSNIGEYTAILGLLAIGQSFVVLIREIDLSVGSVYGIVGIAFVGLENNNVSDVLAFVLAMLLALLVGLVNAALVIRGKLSSMIVTLGGLFFYRGLIYIITHGAVTGVPQAVRQNWFAQLLGGHSLRIQNGFLLLLILGFLCAVTLHETRFGNHLLALGGDPASAESRGVPLGKVRTIAFALCSLFAGLSAIVTLTNDPETSVSLGTGMELEAIAAVVVGGTLLTGGRGTMLGTILGSFFLTAVRSEIIALGAPPSWYVSFVGIALLTLVTINTLLLKRLRISG
ncbi:MAG: ABC transporter permease [Verrucomicrobia bacterium]|nr:ABC transporter permease [Verrucomicrobiota bacterium]